NTENRRASYSVQKIFNTSPDRVCGFAPGRCESGRLGIPALPLLRPLRGDILFSTALPISVMDFDQPMIDRNRNMRRNDFRGRSRPAQRAGICSVETNCRKMRLQRFRLAVTDAVQRHIEVSLESLLDIPIRLAVTNGNQHPFPTNALPHATRCRMSTCSTLKCGSPAFASC